MKFAYSQAKKKALQEGVTASFFFNARGDELEKSTAGMYRSLLLQLLETQPDLQEILDDPDLVSRYKRPSFTWEIGMLYNLFVEATERLGQRPLNCFIDALDECDEDQVRTMIEEFENLGQHSVNIGGKLHICFSSRHYPHIDIQRGRQLILEDQVGHGKDLERYVRNKLRAGTGKFVKEIETEVLQKAGGVFMWAVLVVAILNKEFSRGRNFAVKKRLQEIPAELSELFKDILRRDNENMADLLLCIQWILYAERPLKPEEFYFAVMSGLDPDQALVEWNPEYTTAETMNLFVLSSSKGLAEITRSKNHTVQYIHESVQDFLIKDKALVEWNPEYTTEETMDLFVLSSSKGLAEITRSKDHTVQFIHESVQDFLIKDNGLYDLWPDLAEDFPSMSHERLKQCCYNHIQTNISNYVAPDKTLPKAESDEAKSLRDKISGMFPFLQYATCNVLYHADRAATRLPQVDFLKAFNFGSWRYLHNMFSTYNTSFYTSSVSLLYVLAETDLAELIKVILSYRPEEFHEQGGQHQYPLFAALANGSRNAVKALLQLEHNPLKDDITAQLEYGRDFAAIEGQTPLFWAVAKGLKEIVQLLLARGAEVDSKDSYGQTPLSRASNNGHNEVVQILLDKGAKVDSKDNFGRTPLSQAFEWGHKEVIQLLLNRKAELDSKDYFSQTPLSRASERGHKEVVQLLLSKGAEVDSKDDYSRTPLSRASEWGYKGVVQLLLNKGAKVDSKDNFSRTPLSQASEWGHKEVVQLLLNREAELDSKDYFGQTPLSQASKRGHKEVVQLLLNRGAEVDSKDNFGRTPLSQASEEGHKEVVQLFLNRGAKVDSKDYFSQTPLSRASKKGHKEVVQLLLNRGAEVDSKDSYGQTPLSRASEWGHKEVVQLFLNRGAKVDSKDSYGQTPLSWAAARGNREIVQILLNTKKPSLV
jgi:ankyrin repeat protein